MIGALFPGQGSQFVGMGKALLESFSDLSMVFEEASDELGYDMKALCFQGPEEKLQMTEFTQPALLTLEWGTYQMMKTKGGLPVGAAGGHSLGEYGALVAAQVLPFAQALQLVQKRGRLMQQAVPLGEGGMLALMGPEPDEVEAFCHWACEQTGLGPLEPANFNAPSQTVVSGKMEVIQWALKNFTHPDRGFPHKGKWRLIPLKVSAPFHCSMMKEAQEEMAQTLMEVEFKKPLFGISQNFTGQIEKEPEKIKAHLIDQISGSVRWVSCVNALSHENMRVFAELGPGKALTGLMKKINPDLICVPIHSPKDVERLWAEVDRLN